jgi:hypothetical protein
MASGTNYQHVEFRTLLLGLAGIEGESPTTVSLRAPREEREKIFCHNGIWHVRQLEGVTRARKRSANGQPASCAASD